MSATGSGEFQGTGRFCIQRQVGAGGMGVVYQAYDQERNEVVALKTLKTLHGLDGDAIYRLRNEFRVRADLVHPNFVNLYELFAEGDHWFFTMELVHGVDFLEYVRAGWSGETRNRPQAVHSHSEARPEPSSDLKDAADGSTLRGDTPQTTIQQATAMPPVPGEPHPETTWYTPCALASTTRLRAVLRQLADALDALHRAGLLHRDIKPSNVLVTQDGRVVLLDFGLAVARERAERDDLSCACVVGTASYMSPEQARQAPLTPATDWYSVGVMLFEALTGRLPLAGRGLELLQRKQEVDAPAPRAVSPGIPDDLNALCVDLLRRDPIARPIGADVLRRLTPTVEPAMQVPPPVHVPCVSRMPFIARMEHLRVLCDALELVQRGQTTAVYISGDSGVGKTALVREFLARLDGRAETVLLKGKCHERESIPYKALDTIAESLAQCLVRLPRHEVEALLPREVVALARVFPILRRVEAIAAARPRESSAPDQQKLRQRAFNALRELLARFGDRKTLVLHIDDFQWGDLDSAALLRDLLRPPDPPLLLLLLSYRSEDRATSQVLKAMLDPQCAAGSGVETQHLVVQPLTLDESRELAQTLLASTGSDSASLCEAIARESSGNPYFIEAMARQHRGAGHAGQAPAVSLDDVLWLRAEELCEPARRLLHIVAVAGHPLRQIDACEATGLTGERHEALATLRVAHLIRTGGEGLEDEIDAYHDRVRETVIRRLTAATVVDCHRRLARTLENSGRTDAAELAAHFAAAGENDKASDYYVVAATHAAEALAFDYAAGLYQLALELRPPSAMESRDLRIHLADALANAGRGAEAAAQYLAAVEGAHTEQSQELRRRAAMQFLISGHIDRGTSVLREAMAAMGMKLPRGPRRAIVSLLLRRWLLRIRGLEFQEREASKIPQKDLAKIDMCWSAAVGLALVDPLRSADFLSRGLLLALRAGEPDRIARLLALEAAIVAMAGDSAKERVKRLVEKAAAIARRIDSVHATGLASAAEGVAACIAGHWKRGIDLCGNAQRILRDECTGVWWELALTEGFPLSALCYSGQVGELARLLPGAVAAARNRGDFLVLSRLGTLFLPALAADSVEEAQRELRACMSPWPQAPFTIQHFNELYADLHLRVYRGDVIAAWKRIKDEENAIRKSLILWAQLARGLFYDVRARCALAAATMAAKPKPLVRAAERDALRLERDRTPWMEPLAQRIRAGVAAMQGNEPMAVALLRNAIVGFDAADMPLHAAVARQRLGELLKGQEGQALIDESNVWMASQGIKNPPRMTALYAPGFRD